MISEEQQPPSRDTEKSPCPGNAIHESDVMIAIAAPCGEFPSSYPCSRSVLGAESVCPWRASARTPEFVLWLLLLFSIRGTVISDSSSCFSKGYTTASSSMIQRGQWHRPELGFSRRLQILVDRGRRVRNHLVHCLPLFVSQLDSQAVGNLVRNTDLRAIVQLSWYKLTSRRCS